MNDDQKSQLRTRVERIGRDAHLKDPSIDWAMNRLIEAHGNEVSDAEIAKTLAALSPLFPTQFGGDVSTETAPRISATDRLEKANAEAASKPKAEPTGAKNGRKASCAEEAKAVAALPTHLRLAWSNGDFDAPGFSRGQGGTQ